MRAHKLITETLPSKSACRINVPVLGNFCYNNFKEMDIFSCAAQLKRQIKHEKNSDSNGTFVLFTAAMIYSYANHGISLSYNNNLSCLLGYLSYDIKVRLRKSCFNAE